LKAAKRLGVRQSPAAFPRRRVEKSVSGRDVQEWDHAPQYTNRFVSDLPAGQAGGCNSVLPMY